jgi:hypothetical protein
MKGVNQKHFKDAVNSLSVVAGEGYIERKFGRKKSRTNIDNLSKSA